MLLPVLVLAFDARPALPLCARLPHDIHLTNCPSFAFPHRPSSPVNSSTRGHDTPLLVIARVSDEVGLLTLLLCVSHCTFSRAVPWTVIPPAQVPTLFFLLAMSLRPLVAILTIFPRVLRLDPFIRLEA